MARTTRAAAAASQPSRTSTTVGSTKKEEPDVAIKTEEVSPQKSSKKRQPPASPNTPKKRVKKERTNGIPSPSLSENLKSPPSTKKPKTKETKASDLQSKKLKAYAAYAKQSPFPDFLHPTPEESKLAHRILSKLHGARNRPKEVIARSDRAGCGDSPSVLDALVRTILSQNTSDTNSTRAKLSMDKIYGGSDKWDAIANGGETKLQEAIKSGGLSVVKSKVIISILNQTKEKYGVYSLDHLHNASTEDAMTEMLSFQGVGPKTASCVLLFCLQREDFAVDTHVHRITGLLGWRPKNASREETYAHLNVKIPDEDKYGLHILLVGHGKKCDECKAGGKNLGKCELRKAFRTAKLEGKAGEEVKEEEEQMKEEEEEQMKEEEEEQMKEEED